MLLREIRHIDTDKVRSLCIRQEYYTNGTNDEYCKMFQKCKLNYGVSAIASDIMGHSDTERLKTIYGIDEREIFENICFELINDCSWTEIVIETMKCKDCPYCRQDQNERYPSCKYPYNDGYAPCEVDDTEYDDEQ